MRPAMQHDRRAPVRLRRHYIHIRHIQRIALRRVAEMLHGPGIIKSLQFGPKSRSVVRGAAPAGQARATAIPMLSADKSAEKRIFRLRTHWSDDRTHPVLCLSPKSCRQVIRGLNYSGWRRSISRASLFFGLLTLELTGQATI